MYRDAPKVVCSGQRVRNGPKAHFLFLGQLSFGEYAQGTTTVGIDRTQLDRALFPVGEYQKSAIRAMAAELGLNEKHARRAGLLHDIGKGRDEDHSVLGAQIARKVAPRLGLNRTECDTVEWLVR